MFFRDIIGHEEVKQHLIQSVKMSQIPHAQLFTGNRGIGKLPLALAYAQYLNCESPQEEDSCGVCPSCVKYGHLAHPDLHYVFPIIKKVSLKKEICDDYIVQWRDYLKQNIYFDFNGWLNFIGADNSQGLIYAKESDEIVRKLSLKVYEAKYKVMIIWLPEKMHEVCANKLLKIIEEPFDNTIFILVSDDSDKIINTIQSRCQRINIKGLKDSEIANDIRLNYNVEADEAQLIAHLAKGSYLDALDYARLSDERQLFFDSFIKIMRASYARNIKQIKFVATELSSIGRETQKNFFVYCQHMLREYFISNLHQPKMIYLTKNESDFGVKFAPFINENNIYGLMDELALAERHIEQNVNPKIVFFDLCLKITILIKQ